jgi:transcriptional regulator with XRE-family HTH domain
MIVKTHEWTNEKVAGQLEEFPYFTIKCNIHEILKERGLKLEELAELTGIRIGGLSELANMKRSTISVPHLLVIAKVLRITDINELIDFSMPQGTAEQFEKDQEYIKYNGLLPEQDEILSWKRYENNLIKEFKKTVRKIKSDKLKAEKKAKKEAEKEAKRKAKEAEKAKQKEEPTTD